MKTLITIPEPNKVCNFPKLMIHEDGDQIVLFVTKSIGVIMHDYINHSRFGEYSADMNNEKFVDFNGEITLKND